MSRASALAEAIKDILNDVEFSVPVVATRRYRAFYDLKQLKELKVTVVAGSIEQEIMSRVGNLDIITVGIIIQKQIDPDDNTALDVLSSLVEEIAENFRGTRAKQWQWVGTAIETPYNMESLSNWRVFESVIELKYQLCWRKG